MEPCDIFRTITYKFTAYPLRCVFLNFTNPHFKATIGTRVIILLLIIFEIFGVYLTATKSVEVGIQTAILSALTNQVNFVCD